MTDAHEYPPASAFTAAASTTSTPGEFAVTFNAVAGKSYTVRYKDDVTAATWTVLRHFPVQTVSAPITMLDTPPALTVKGFYQVQLRSSRSAATEAVFLGSGRNC